MMQNVCCVCNFPVHNLVWFLKGIDVFTNIFVAMTYLAHKIMHCKMQFMEFILIDANVNEFQCNLILQMCMLNPVCYGSAPLMTN